MLEVFRVAFELGGDGNEIDSLSQAACWRAKKA
jgi:hypothetical protein